MAIDIGVRNASVLNNAPGVKLSLVTAGVSMIVLAALGAGVARAECLPSAPVAGQPIACTGTIDHTVDLKTDGSQLTLAAGASLLPTTGDGLRVAIPSDGYSTYYHATITVDGRIAAVDGNGILVLPGDNAYRAGTFATITVGQGASVAGQVGISVGQGPYSYGGTDTASALIINSGTITGTSGIAISSATPTNRFEVGVINTATGTIGAIAGQISTLTNAGLIDGGTHSVISSSSYNANTTVSNTGTIRSASARPTIEITGTSGGQLTNSGTIINTGGGAALAGVYQLANQSGATISGRGGVVIVGDSFHLFNSGNVTNTGSGMAIAGNDIVVVNGAGDLISGGTGHVAIVANRSLGLVNSGTIAGDVVAGAGSYVALRHGQIIGNLTFKGAGNTFAETLENGVAYPAVTGTITAAAGDNTIEIVTDYGLTLSHPVVLPQNFNHVVLRPESGATLTLANGYSSPGTIDDAGWGTLANATTLTGTDAVINATGSQGAIVNTGTISSSGGIGAIVTRSSSIQITNSGLIAQTGDQAAIFNAGTVHNLAGGTVTSSGQSTISGYRSNITNAGTLTNTGHGNTIGVTDSGTVSNTAGGTITGNGHGAAVISGSQLTVTNAGAIRNEGTGTAIEANSLMLIQGASGVLAGGSDGNALTVAQRLQLYNLGTISGAISAGAGSTINSSRGTINGDVTLYGNNNTLVAALEGGVARTGIAGKITANGAGNTIRLTVATDSTLNGALALPDRFDLLAFATDARVTLTLGAGFVAQGPMRLTGAGTLVNAGTLSQGDTVLTGDLSGGNLVNTGTIAMTGSGSNAAIMTGNALLTNKGTITSSGLGISTQGGGVINTGTITSTGATAVSLWQNDSATTSTNSGTISGTQTGVALGNGVLANSGAITAGSTGVLLDGHATLINAAGGLVRGPVAVQETDARAWLVNAGRIEGDVLVGDGAAITLQAGGMLDGNLRLGIGSTLLVDPAATGGPGTLAGAITGTITANRSNLLYAITADATLTTAAIAPAGFAAVGYRLSNDAALTLGLTGTQTVPLWLSGKGTVTFGGTLATTQASAVTVSPLTNGNGAAAVPSALTLINTGTLSTLVGGGGPAGVSTVALGDGDSLDNRGTIALTSAGSASSGAAISGGLRVANSGLIAATGASGVRLHTGNAAPDGVPELINSGTIRSNTDAVTIDQRGTVINTGTIAGKIAGGGADGDSYAVVRNQAGGTISATGNSIEVAAGLVVNSGTIGGSVNLGVVRRGDSSTSTAAYIADGGKLHGDLVFGRDARNVLVETGSGFGVTGTVRFERTIIPDGQINAIGHLRRKTATVTLGGALPYGFAYELALAEGAATQITLTGTVQRDGRSIFVGGDGAIINRVSSDASLATLDFAGIAMPGYSDVPLAALTNEATVNGIAATATSLTNSGQVNNTITQKFDGNAQFTNTGTVTYGVFGVYSADRAGSMTYAITNSGSIGTQAMYRAYTAIGFNANAGSWPSPDLTSAITLTNSGRITGDILLPDSGVTITDTVGGTIQGDILLRANYGGYWALAPNHVTIAGGFVGSIDGGLRGGASLAVSGGSTAAPVRFGSLSNITAYTQTGGYATISYVAQAASVTITGGDLVGLVGSRLTAATVSIGARGRFQSGGLVTGSIFNAGTLVVGASPDTLGVVGNVTLSPGSTTVFEVSPRVSSHLVVSGKVTIDAGTTLQIKPLQAIMPGTSLDLVSASGGISGTFAKITGLYGKLRVVDGDLELLTLFDPGLVPGRQLGRDIDYVNDALFTGTAPAALWQALPLLTTASGAPNAAAFARIGPEPYAAAVQVGVENGLILSRAARDIGAGSGPHTGHLFSFGQALGNWRGMNAEGGDGAASARIAGYGFLGGLGVETDGLSLAAFGGYLDQTQSIAALGATTHASGFVGGVVAGVEQGDFAASAALVRDQSDGRTERQLPGGGKPSTVYDLHGWTADAQIGLRLAMGLHWQVRPHLGTTWVWTDRAGLHETDGSVFALRVAATRHTAGFADAGLRFESAPGAQHRLTGFADLGLRWQFQGRTSTALGAFAALPLTLGNEGPRRSPVSGLITTGAAYRIAPAVHVTLTGSGEMAAGGSSANVTGGVRVAF